MKKLFAVVLVLMLVLCGCGKESVSSSTEIISSGFSSSDVFDLSSIAPVESDTSSSLYIAPTGEYSKWNTKYFTNNFFSGKFYYDEQQDTYYYAKMEFRDEIYTYSLIAEKNGVKRVISNEPAWDIYLFEDKLYYTNGEEIISINTDGSNRTVLKKTDDAKFIYPYKEDVYYCSNYDWKLHKISSDGTETVIDTGDKQVHYYVIYEDKIYYGGYPDIYLLTNIYSIDIETHEQKLVFDELTYMFEILNDKIYFISEEDEVVRCNLDGTNREKIVSEGTAKFFVYSDKIIYFPIKGRAVREFDLRTCSSKRLFFSGEVWHQCSEDFIVSITDDGKITKVEI